LHLALARVLEQTPGVEPDALVVHYLAGGARAQALLHMRRSARHLVDALAFDRAVSMYKRLLTLSDAGSDAGSDVVVDDRLAVREELAVALENAGRCEEAGRAWLALAEEHTGATRQQLRQRAADNLIRSGHVDEGLAAQKAALDRLGVRVSRSAWLALPFIVLDRIRLRLRGLGYRLQPSSHADPRRLARIDASMALGAVLPLIDTIRGLQVHGQALRDALAAGEPARLARALAMEAGYRNALSGGVDRRGRIDALLATAGLVAEASGEPRAKGTVAIMYGSARWSVGDWAGCISHCQRGLERLRGECTGVSWEINFALTHSINALLWSGRLNDHRREALASLADARARGDLYAEVMYSVRDLATLHVQADAPDAARATRQELERWTNRGFQIEHLVELYQQSEVMLYEQRGDEAWAWVTSRWSALRRSQLLRLQVFRIELRALRARAALCALADLPRGRSRARLVAEARSLARAIAREAPAVRALVLGAPLTAAVAAIDGRDDAARAALEAGIHAAQVHGMRLHEAGMQACLGHRIGGDVGRAQVADAARWMHDQGIAAPARYLRMLAPGLAPEG
ncbi:MAG: hypothetical protein IT385_27850, partial [Deltaproteobacteria bacterium]|nr:hypothetical protein [Deltaproteobacteria bacterium]